MGQELPNGIYLPAEGERNCYDGLEGNWRSLDSLISTVAGKASATHTHGNITNDGKVGTTANLPLITGTGGAITAGAFGNQANTFCEGNDSRLSDARTPVAHTHGKADITDLFNSANTWTGRQTYGAYLKSFGEARTDEWSSNSRTNAYLLSRRDTNDVSGFLISTFRQNVAQGTAGHIYGWDILENSTRYSGLRFTIDWDSTLNSGNGAYSVTLGTNTQGTNPCNDLHITQLKTINGVNPGALSLPNLTMQTYDPNNGWYDLDTTDWDLTGSPIDISSNILKDGYLYVCLACDSTGYVVICEGVFGYPNCYYSTSGLPVSGYARALLPVRKGTDVRLYLKGTSIYAARLFPALGNV